MFGTGYLSKCIWWKSKTSIRKEVNRSQKKKKYIYIAKLVAEEDTMKIRKCVWRWELEEEYINGKNSDWKKRKAIASEEKRKRKGEIGKEEK